MDLSIIIVSYNTKALIKQCLESLFRYLGNALDFEVIVIDNKSEDGTQGLLETYAKSEKRVKFILSDTNSGFAAANNQGISIASGRNVLFLNSDTYLVDDSIKIAVNWLDSQENVFGCGCCLLNPDGSNGISYGKFPELKTILIEILSNRFNSLRAVVPEQEPSPPVFEIDFPCGAFFLVKSSILKALNGFDEGFFMYFEETDLARRALKAGYKIFLNTNTRLVHIGGASSNSKSSNQRSQHLQIAFYRSWEYYLSKHLNIYERYLIRFLVLTFLNIHLIRAKICRKNSSYIIFKNEIQAVKKGWK